MVEDTFFTFKKLSADFNNFTTRKILSKKNYFCSHAQNPKLFPKSSFSH